MNFRCYKYSSQGVEANLDPEFLSTGSSNIDELLGGGICPGEVTEIFGEQGSGTTQLALSLCRSVDNQGGKALVIDSDGSVDMQRLREMKVTEDAVHIVRMCNADYILACLIHALPKMLQGIGNVRLLIIDSIAFVSRATTMAHPIKRCQIFAGRLGHLARQYNFAVVIVNDVKSAVETPVVLATDFEFSTLPTAAMGAQWAHICPTRLALTTNMYGTRYAVLVKSVRQACGHAVFEIGSSGVCDAE